MPADAWNPYDRDAVASGQGVGFPEKTLRDMTAKAGEDGNITSSTVSQRL
jgi:hypothetical protein